MIAAIASMPQLRELCLESIDLVEVDEPFWESPTLEVTPSSYVTEGQKAGQVGFISSMLTGLADCRSLKVLKLVCLHDNVTLTR